MQSNNYAYVNGRFVSEAEATVSIFDRGFLYGDGVFETMRVYHGRVFRLFEHVRRLMAGIEALRIEFGETAEHLQGVCEETVARNQVADGMVRVYVTRGMGNIGLSVKTVARPTIIAVSQERTILSTESGLSVIVATTRVDPLSRLVQIKSANRLPYVLAKIEAERRGVDDAILLNTSSHVVELSASNIFAYRDGKLITPPVSEGALPGIARAATLALGAQSGIQIAETSFTVGSLYHAEEVFATNSLFEVTPIIAVEDHPIPSGEITSLLQTAYRELVREELLLR